MPIPVDKAMQMVRAAHAEAEQLDITVTAVSFQVPTDQLVPEARQPAFRSLSISSGGRIMVARGGIPIVDGIVVTGAIGVAGAGDDGQDHLCCRAGAATLDRPSH